ncbi:hypothetical protein VH567_15670 [Sphingomonas sp. 4RDLI-65]|uniref:hypothetical protein n=1 Tax=Sphingomonas sp. 4RDLI-65 TaxID=3111641 RepID=UPI003C1699C6
MSGYARAHRGRWEHHLFKNKQEAAVWAWMTDTARWRAHSFQTRFGIVHLERGQVFVSQRMLAEEFGMGRQQVRRLFSDMLNAGMICENSTHSAARAGTIVTIVNYERYQGDTAEIVEGRASPQPKKQPKTNPKATQDQPTREYREKGEEREEGLSPSDSSSSTLPDLPPSLPMRLPAVVPAGDAVIDAFTGYQAVRREFLPGAKTLTLTDVRRTKLAARIREVGGSEGWAKVLASIRGSPFLRGETGPNYRFAEIDWILEPKNFLKINEGNYDDRSGADRVRPPTRSSPLDAMRAARAAVGLGGP